VYVNVTQTTLRGVCPLFRTCNSYSINIMVLPNDCHGRMVVFVRRCLDRIGDVRKDRVWIVSRTVTPWVDSVLVCNYQSTSGRQSWTERHEGTCTFQRPSARYGSCVWHCCNDCFCCRDMSNQPCVQATFTRIADYIYSITDVWIVHSLCQVTCSNTGHRANIVYYQSRSLASFFSK
jgi:hypothetical protein